MKKSIGKTRHIDKISKTSKLTKLDTIRDRYTIRKEANEYLKQHVGTKNIIIPSLDVLDRLRINTTEVFKYLSSILSPSDVAYKVNESIIITVDNTPEIIDAYSNQDNILVIDPQNNDGFSMLNLVLDVSKIGKVGVLQPGLFNLSELEDISPLPITKMYTDDRDDLKPITPDILRQCTISGMRISAPKEVLINFYPELKHRYFRIVDNSAALIHNLGSISSPDLMIKNLQKIVDELADVSLKLESATYNAVLVWADTVYDHINETARYILAAIQSRYGHLIDIYVATDLMVSSRYNQVSE